ncbi:HGGxSTG domain-containing protein [Pantoea dispersa]
MDSRASLLKQLKFYHQRSRERFDRWQASGYRHELKPTHEPVPDELSHIPCAAKTRAGTPCKRTVISANGRCKFHGGHSTGARTAEGKARQLEGYRRWQRQKITAEKIASKAEY